MPEFPDLFQSLYIQLMYNSLSNSFGDFLQNLTIKIRYHLILDYLDFSHILQGVHHGNEKSVIVYDCF